MTCFHQSCPSCAAELELPAEADGKAAVCPACQTQFIANATVTTKSTDTATPTATRTPSPQPIDAPLRPVSIESVMGETHTIFSGRRRPLILPFLIPSLLVVIGFVLPLVYLNDLAIVNQPKAITWTAVLSPWFLALSVYAFWFASNLAIDVCDAEAERDHEPRGRIRSWLLPEGRVFVGLLLTVAAATVIFGVLLVLAAAYINMGRKIETFEVRMLMTAGAFLCAFAVAIGVAMRFWPLIPLAMEGRWGVNAAKRSLAITAANLMTSFLLIAALSFLVGVGFSLFGIGLPFAIPYAALALVVALRLMENRRIPALDADVG